MVLSYIPVFSEGREPAVTETTTAPAVTGFHHFSSTVPDVEATLSGTSGSSG